MGYVRSHGTEGFMKCNFELKPPILQMDLHKRKIQHLVFQHLNQKLCPLPPLHPV